MENDNIFAKIEFLLFSWVPPSKISFRPLCIKRMSLFADPPPRLVYLFSATWAIWCSFRREFQAKLDFEMLSTILLIWSFFFYWKNCVFFHIQRGRPFFMTPSLPPRHLMSSFCKPPSPPHGGTSFVNSPYTPLKDPLFLWELSSILIHPRKDHVLSIKQ